MSTADNEFDGWQIIRHPDDTAHWSRPPYEIYQDEWDQGLEVFFNGRLVGHAGPSLSGAKQMVEEHISGVLRPNVPAWRMRRSK